MFPSFLLPASKSTDLKLLQGGAMLEQKNKSRRSLIHVDESPQLKKGLASPGRPALEHRGFTQAGTAMDSPSILAAEMTDPMAMLHRSHSG